MHIVFSFASGRGSQAFHGVLVFAFVFRVCVYVRPEFQLPHTSVACTSAQWMRWMDAEWRLAAMHRLQFASDYIAKGFLLHLRCKIETSFACSASVCGVCKYPTPPTSTIMNERYNYMTPRTSDVFSAIDRCNCCVPKIFNCGNFWRRRLQDSISHFLFAHDRFEFEVKNQKHKTPIWANVRQRHWMEEIDWHLKLAETPATSIADAWKRTIDSLLRWAAHWMCRANFRIEFNFCVTHTQWLVTQWPTEIQLFIDDWHMKAVYNCPDDFAKWIMRSD